MGGRVPRRGALKGSRATRDAFNCCSSAHVVETKSRVQLCDQVLLQQTEYLLLFKPYLSQYLTH